MQLSRRQFGKLIAGTVVLLATAREAVSKPLQRFQRDERKFCIMAFPADTVANRAYGPYVPWRADPDEPKPLISKRKIADILGSRAIVENGFVWYKVPVRSGMVYGENHFVPAGPLTLRYHAHYTELVADERMVLKDKLGDRAPPSALFSAAYPLLMTDDFIEQS